MGEAGDHQGNFDKLDCNGGFYPGDSAGQAEKNISRLEIRIWVMKCDYDLIVIGGGAGGLFAASVANSLGAKTCMIDKTRLGGDCTWFGCMPSKALLTAGAHGFDGSRALAHVKDVVNEIATHHPKEVFEKRGISVLFGKTQFIDKNTIQINDQKLSAKKFIISTGSHPAIPPIEGLNVIDYFTNENIFDLKTLPSSLIVLGGGPIGIELSQALSRLGVKVYNVEMLDRIMFREDAELSGILENSLKKSGVQLMTGRRAVRFFKKDNRVFATLEGKEKGREEISADNVLVAVGRAPNVDGLALEKAGVEYTKRGINVNAYLRTTNKDIFAIGDVVGPYMFSHVAAYQAQVSVRNALLRRLAWQKVNYENVAWATFTDPELAHLGITEDEAKEKGINVDIYKTEYGAVDRAVTDSEKDGLVKVITDKKGYILGAHIVGAKAGEIIQGFIIAKSMRMPLSKLATPLFIYPTLSELVKKTAAKPLLEKLNSPLVKFVIRMLRRK